jgi:hypothetical protein
VVGNQRTTCVLALPSSRQLRGAGRAGPANSVGGSHDAIEQADEADEAPLERERGMVLGGQRGCAVIVSVPACSGASQLIRSVRQTGWRSQG